MTSPKVPLGREKAEKDQLLGSSSPNSMEESPYFGKPNAPSAIQRKIQNQDKQRDLVEKSVDDLQAGVRSSSNTPYRLLRGEEIIDRLISGNAESTNISKPARGRPKKPNAPSASFSLKGVVYPGLDDGGAYIVRVTPGLGQFSINLDRELSPVPRTNIDPLFNQQNYTGPIRRRVYRLHRILAD